jgi:catechol 2,3-dioxygenase-like lactoylglutathione lyase family enzyme
LTPAPEAHSLRVLLQGASASQAGGAWPACDTVNQMTPAASTMSSIDHFRKQAKLYLRWHREGYYPVAAQIGALLPRFRGMADPEILAAKFQLHDAQELVARKAGFECWPALIKELDSMTQNQTSSPAPAATILASEPQLFVTDLEAAFAFYGKLGFSIAFAYGEPPFYAQVVRDGGRLNLRKVGEGPVFDSGFRARERDVLAATLTVDDAKALFLELQQAGVPFHQSLRREPWGARTFIVRDPDDNLILFAGD